MSEIAVFILLGLGSGALIAGIGIAIVLDYQGSGTVNLAAGAEAMLGAYVFFDLRTNGALPTPPIPFVPAHLGLGGPWALGPAACMALLVCALTALLFNVLVIRRLQNDSPLVKLVASLGLLLTIQALMIQRFGPDGVSAANVLPVTSNLDLHVFAGVVPGNRLMLAAIVVVIGLALAAIYRATRFGSATRAAAENQTTAELLGLRPGRIAAVNSMLAAVVAGAVGILVAPTSSLDPTTIAFAVIPALAAALLARFSSLAITVAAGLAMGAIQSVLVYLQTLKWFPTTADHVPLPGVADLVFFVVIVVAMLIRGNALPDRGELLERSLPSVPAMRGKLPRSTTVLALGGVIALLVLPVGLRQAVMLSMVGATLCLSVVVITGFVGQVSLLQLGTAGVAAFVVAKLGSGGLGFPLATVVGIAVATVIGAVTAVSALRVRGVQLAIVTLAGAVALASFGFANVTWGGGTSGAPVNYPHFLGINLGPTARFPVNDSLPSPVFGFVCLAALILMVTLVARIRISSLGRRMLTVRSNERAAAALGTNVTGVKLAGFAIASAIAGLAGTLYAYNFGSVVPERYDAISGVALIAYAYLGGITSIGGALLAGLFVTGGVNLYVLEQLGVPGNWELLLAGLALMVTVALNPAGVAAELRRVRESGKAQMAVRGLLGRRASVQRRVS
ncbi:MAG TPA: ABC transporter permease [Solirubrobacteraceae bacterium]|jgi:branched-chain amino acid transport system permease protein